MEWHKLILYRMTQSTFGSHWQIQRITKWKIIKNIQGERSIVFVNGVLTHQCSPIHVNGCLGYERVTSDVKGCKGEGHLNAKHIMWWQINIRTRNALSVYTESRVIGIWITYIHVRPNVVSWWKPSHVYIYSQSYYLEVSIQVDLHGASVAVTHRVKTP